MDDCIFCKIIRGEISSLEVYSDDVVNVFLDVNPVAEGHMLVIPKEHFENVFEVLDNVMSHISKVCKKMAILCKEKLGATGVNILNASGKDAEQTVFHLHYHVVPRFENDGINLWFHGKSSDNSELIEILDKLK